MCFIFNSTDQTGEKNEVTCALGSKLIPMACLHGYHKGCVGCDLFWQTFIGSQFCTKTMVGTFEDLESCFFIYLYAIQTCIEEY